MKKHQCKGSPKPGLCDKHNGDPGLTGKHQRPRSQDESKISRSEMHKGKNLREVSTAKGMVFEHSMWTITFPAEIFFGGGEWICSKFLQVKLKCIRLN